MLEIRDAYGNTAASGFSIDFFELSALGAQNAYLACPFVSTYRPIAALTRRGCRVQLLVRLCSITPPAVLAEALRDPLVTVRYFTSRSFHAKLYIVDDVAMVGSANLTESGLWTNREVSVVLRRERDAAFDALPPLFNAFWDAADVLNEEVLAQYVQAYRTIGRAVEEAEFQRALEQLVPPVEPPSAKVGSGTSTKRRSFVQALRRKYDEEVVPAFREVERAFLDHGMRRPEFQDGDVEIELGRLLGWVRIVFAPGETWRQVSLAGPDERRARVAHFANEWVATADTRAGDMFDADTELAKIAHLREALSTPERIAKSSYDEIFDALVNVHAFYDRLRFSPGGLEGLRRQFGRDNTLPRLRETLAYLIHGPGTSLDRAYDVISDERYSLAGFGESCTMELLGWMDSARPPVNGRTIKALRFLGFDVRE